jgi:hypothetical protein
MDIFPYSIVLELKNIQYALLVEYDIFARIDICINVAEVTIVYNYMQVRTVFILRNRL